MKHIIIAEAGVNHNGDISLAYKLIDTAKAAGADYVKFQTGTPKLLISKFAQKAEYQKVNTGDAEESQQEMCEKISLKMEDFALLRNYCNQIGIKFLSTPFDLLAIDVLSKLDMDFWKIPSGEITNYPYLVKIAQTGKPIVMSTGMCEIEEIREALSLLCKNGAKMENITLLHCTTEYPTPMEDVNLSAMLQLKKEFGVRVGYSDHTRGIEIPIAAVALGAEIIEKHFTLDRTLPGPDHVASLEPDELKVMVDAIRNVEKAIGDGRKRVSNSERKNIEIARKSIVAARDIKKGELFSEDNLTTKRPGNGMSPMHWKEVIGTKAIRDFDEDELIEV